jgi:uncharacterized protein DUF4345
MSPWLQRSTWLGRIVLAGAVLLLLRISLAYIIDPAGAVAPNQITLGSPAALTVMRVSGGVFLAVALALGVCVTSERRLLEGLTLLAIFATTITATRLIGLAIDGPAPFTLKVLKPEVALVLLSSGALLVERRRRQGTDAPEVTALPTSRARPEHP